MAGTSPSVIEIRPVGGDGPQPIGFDRFCRQVGEAVWSAPDGQAPARVAALLPGLLANPDLLSAAQRVHPAEAYGRHTLFICPDERFSVIAAVWPAGIVSPVHDHFTWCAFGVYEGVIEETRYAPVGPDDNTDEAGTRARATAVFERLPGDVDHLPLDAPDIHSMHNPTDRAAISIHVYGGDCRKTGPNLKKLYTVDA